MPSKHPEFMTRIFGVLRRLKSRRGRSLLVAMVLLAAAVFYLWFSDSFYPIQHWLFFRYMRVWSCVALFISASLVSGWWLLAHIVSEPPRLSTRLLLSMAVGVLAFYSLMFLFGIAQLYSSATFYTVPLILLGLGGPRVIRDAQRMMPRLRPIGLRLLQPRNYVEVLAAVLIGVSLLALYMQVLLPRNLHADAHWYHLPIAEHYVAAGGIVRFPEGWYVGVYPQLVSILYTWVFLSPGDLFSHVSLCLHLDFALFLVTVFGVAILSARILGVRRFPAAAAAVFLFPNLFIYDSNINGSADHMLGFWAVPLALALMRLHKRFGVREAVLAGLMTAAAAVTKYQACFFVVPATIFVVALAARHRRLVPLVAWIATTAVVSSSHWLKNLIYYHDPLYPLLHQYFPSVPFHEGASITFHAAYWDHRWLASGPWSAKLWAATKALVTFSFVPNDFDWHGQRPTLGSLFTLLLPVLVLVKAPWRLWSLVLGTHLGVFIWYLTSHQDRYLQALLPWMATCVAVLLAHAYKKGKASRIAAGALVVVQVVGGLDVYFIRTHVMIGDSVIRAVSSLLSDGHRNVYDERFVVASTFQKLGSYLTTDAILLQHTVMAKLGLGVRVVADGTGWQGAIEYLQHDSPQVTASLMQGFGVNKAVRYNDPGGLNLEDSARELVFLRWLNSYGGHERIVNEAKLTNVLPRPTNAALALEPTRIALLDCQMGTRRGLYTPRGLALGQTLQQFTEQELKESPEPVVDGANALIMRDSCPEFGTWSAALSSRFARRMSAGPINLWVRTSRH